MKYNTIIAWIFVCIAINTNANDFSKSILKKQKPLHEFEYNRKYAIINEIANQKLYDRSYMLYDSVTPIYDEAGIINNGIKYKKLKDKVFTLVELRKENFPLKGNNDFTMFLNKNTLKDVYVFNCDGIKYKIVALQSNSINSYFENLYDITHLEEIKKNLVGKTVYPTTIMWNKEYFYKDNIIPSYELENNKSCMNCAVVINRIEKSNKEYYKVFFKKLNDTTEYFITTTLDPNDYNYFENRFNFSNPIEFASDETKKFWKDIQKGNITKGMSRKLVESILGEAYSTNKQDNEHGIKIYCNYRNVFSRDYQIVYNENELVTAVYINDNKW